MMTVIVAVAVFDWFQLPSAARYTVTLKDPTVLKVTEFELPVPEAEEPQV